MHPPGRSATCSRHPRASCGIRPDLRLLVAGSGSAAAWRTRTRGCGPGFGAARAHPARAPRAAGHRRPGRRRGRCAAEPSRRWVPSRVARQFVASRASGGFRHDLQSEIFSHRRRGASLWRGAGDMQHARNSTGALARAALAVGARPGVGAGPAGTDAMLAAVRGIGQVGVPENYGQVKDGPGTKFLGTPANHREVRARSRFSNSS